MCKNTKAAMASDSHRHAGQRYCIPSTICAEFPRHFLYRVKMILNNVHRVCSDRSRLYEMGQSGRSAPEKLKEWVKQGGLGVKSGEGSYKCGD